MYMGEAYIIGGMSATFPLAVLYRRYVYTTSPANKDLFFTITGLCIIIVCFGLSALHLILGSLLSYVVMAVLGITKVSCALIFLSTLSHLLYGYISISGTVYTVTWTLIYCQATLKLVGSVFEIWDLRHEEGVRVPSIPKGMKEDGEEMKEDGEEMKSVPSFLTFTAYIYFPFTVIAGPYFTLARYRRFRKVRSLPVQSTLYSKTKLLQGVVYILIYYGGGTVLSTEYLLSPHFNSLHIVLKMLYMTIWSKWLITKYCAIWLMCESSAVLTGIGYDGEGRYDGISNMNIEKFEKSLTIQDELKSFNMQTHIWVKQNIYKRCKPLNSRLISLSASLLFLYIWHGIHPGFFNLFLVEMLGIISEDKLKRYLSKSSFPSSLRPFLVALQYIVKNSAVGYGLSGFALRSFSRCNQFYGSVYYCYHLMLVLWISVETLVISRMSKKDIKTI